MPNQINHRQIEDGVTIRKFEAKKAKQNDKECAYDIYKKVNFFHRIHLKT